MLIPVDVGDGLSVSRETVQETTLKDLALTEGQLEDFLRRHIDLVFDESETLLIVGQQTANAEGGRSDLIALDGNGSIVLIEIKRDPSDMKARREAFEFQAIRYAASLALLHKPDDLVTKVFARYIESHRTEFDLGNLTAQEFGKRRVDEFLRVNGAEHTFNRKQRIILIASGYDEQTRSAVTWLIANDLDIAAFQFSPRRLGEQVLLDITRVLPPERLDDNYVPIADTPSPGQGLPRTPSKKTALPRMATLMKWGVLSPGDVLVIKGREDDSEAEVIDSSRVRFAGQEMGFNDWGKKVTTWSAICIYQWAMPKGGAKTLDELRREKMEELGAEDAS